MMHCIVLIFPALSNILRFACITYQINKILEILIPFENQNVFVIRSVFGRVFSAVDYKCNMIAFF